MTEQYITYEKLSEPTRLKVIESALLSDDPEIQDIINGMKDLINKECKKTISVMVDGKLTEV